MSLAHGECKPSRTERSCNPAPRSVPPQLEARPPFGAQALLPASTVPSLPPRPICQQALPALVSETTLKLRPSSSSASTLFLCPHLQHSGSSLVLLLIGPASHAAAETLGTPGFDQVPSLLLMLPRYHLADSRCQSPYRWPTRPSMTCPHRPSDLMCSHCPGHTGLPPADQACSCLRVLAAAIPSAWNVLHADTTLY